MKHSIDRLFAVIALTAVVTGCGSDEGVRPQTEISAGTPEIQEDVPAEQPVELDKDYPVVAITTSQGTVTVKLDAVNSPITVGSFLWSAANGDYNGTIFHQVEEGYIAVGGEYDETLKKRASAPTIRNEANNGLFNKRHTIAMTRIPGVIDSSTGPFFFNLADNPNLDHKSAEDAHQFGYCVFGTVTEGEGVLEKIAGAPVAPHGELAHVPVEPIVIRSITRLR